MTTILLQFTYLSRFSTYKYHLAAWRKTQQQRITNTRVFSEVFFFSSLYYV